MNKDSSQITALLRSAQRARGQTRYEEAREHLLAAVKIERRMSDGENELMARCLNDRAPEKRLEALRERLTAKSESHV